MLENKEMCAKCGGRCCKRMPGANSPKDFGLPNESLLKQALESGNYAIDCWDGDPRWRR